MKKIKSLFIFSVAFIAVIIFFEIFLSLTGIMVPAVKIDANKGERYFHNKLCCSLFISEGFGLAKTNDAGWFGKEFNHNAKDVSVAVIGNSFVASRQVFYRDNFLSVAENTINQKSLKSKLSFYNFGKEAMPLTELLFVKEEIQKDYQPNYMLVLLNNQSFSNAKRNVPYYKLAGDSLSLDTTFKQSAMVKLYSKIKMVAQSSVLFLGYRVKNDLPKTGEIMLDKFYPSTAKSATESESDFSFKDVDKTIVEKLVKDKKVIFLLDLDTSLSNQIKPLIKESEYIDLRPLLVKMKTEQGIDPNYWKVANVTGHWNIPAHKMIGEVIANRLYKIIN